MYGGGEKRGGGGGGIHILSRIKVIMTIKELPYA